MMKPENKIICFCFDQRDEIMFKTICEPLRKEGFYLEIHHVNHVGIQRIDKGYYYNGDLVKKIKTENCNVLLIPYNINLEKIYEVPYCKEMMRDFYCKEKIIGFVNFDKFEDSDPFVFNPVFKDQHLNEVINKFIEEHGSIVDNYMLNKAHHNNA